MKKKYEKPTIICENFHLSQNIASCNVEISFLDVDTCKIHHAIAGSDAADVIQPGGFTLQNASCTYYISDYCYTNGANFVAVHNS